MIYLQPARCCKGLLQASGLFYVNDPGGGKSGPGDSCLLTRAWYLILAFIIQVDMMSKVEGHVGGERGSEEEFLQARSYGNLIKR